VKGNFVWSAFDNLEWTDGYAELEMNALNTTWDLRLGAPPGM